MSDRAWLILAVLVAVFAILAFMQGAYYTGHRGYPRAGSTRAYVRCRAGHLFTTMWIPLVSFKSVRLGPYRYQRCPVGNHWSLVELLDPATLSPEERERAERHPDARIP